MEQAIFSAVQAAAEQYGQTSGMKPPRIYGREQIRPGMIILMNRAAGVRLAQEDALVYAEYDVAREEDPLSVVFTAEGFCCDRLAGHVRQPVAYDSMKGLLAADTGAALEMTSGEVIRVEMGRHAGSLVRIIAAAMQAVRKSDAPAPAGGMRRRRNAQPIQAQQPEPQPEPQAQQPVQPEPQAQQPVPQPAQRRAVPGGKNDDDATGGLLKGGAGLQMEQPAVLRNWTPDQFRMQDGDAPYVAGAKAGNVQDMMTMVRRCSERKDLFGAMAFNMMALKMGSPAAALNMAEIHMSIGLSAEDYRQALAYAEKAYEMGNDDAEVFLHEYRHVCEAMIRWPDCLQGYACMRKGDMQRAKELLQRAIDEGCAHAAYLMADVDAELSGDKQYSFIDRRMNRMKAGEMGHPDGMLEQAGFKQMTIEFHSDFAEDIAFAAKLEAVNKQAAISFYQTIRTAGLKLTPEERCIREYVPVMRMEEWARHADTDAECAMKLARAMAALAACGEDYEAVIPAAQRAAALGAQGAQELEQRARRFAAYFHGVYAMEQENEDEAICCFEQAAGYGSVPAMHCCYKLLSKREYEPGCDERAMTWMRRAAETGDGDAIRTMADNTRGEERARWRRKGAELGNGMMLLNLVTSICSKAKTEAELDEAEAYVEEYGKRWRDDYELKNAIMGYRLCLRAYHTDDEAEKIALYKQAAELGSHKACYNLGVIYLNIIRNRQKAIEWLKKGDEHFDSDCSYLLARVYIEEGRLEEAKALADKLIKRGDGNGFRNKHLLEMIERKQK
ncbi:MAG: sel1 repeat family protein [Clostridia bacterium]|nr:sel1 repeat family protein [Clostridia bacterium]